MRIARVFALCVCVLLSAASARAAEVPVVLLFGDSIVAGYGLGGEQALSKRLEASLQQRGIKVKVVNGGVSGDTTAAGRGRLAWTLKRYDPDIVLLALGANDMLRGLPPATTRANLDAMLKELAADKNRRVILSSVIAPSNLGAAYQKEFASIYSQLARTYNVALYPFLLEAVYGRTGLMLPDGVHPNAKGVEVMAASLADYISRHYLKPR